MFDNPTYSNSRTVKIIATNHQVSQWLTIQVGTTKKCLTRAAQSRPSALLRDTADKSPNKHLSPPQDEDPQTSKEDASTLPKHSISVPTQDTGIPQSEK